MAEVSLSGIARLCFEAGKNLTIGGELRRKGELVPEAEGWTSDTVAKLQRTGHLRLHVEGEAESVVEADEQEKVEAEGGSQVGAPSASTRKKKGDEE